MAYALDKKTTINERQTTAETWAKYLRAHVETGSKTKITQPVFRWNNPHRGGEKEMPPHRAYYD
jgi:hypothetical protein